MLAQDKQRQRTLVFVSFDGEEAESTGKDSAAGSRAFIERLGPRARSLVAAFAVDMSGWRGGSPSLHPIAYADPHESGRSVIAPAWLVRASLAGAREAGASLAVGDPWMPLALPAGRAHVPRAALRRRPAVPAGGPLGALRLRLVVLRLLPGLPRPRTPPTSSTPRRSSAWGRRCSASCAARARRARQRSRPEWFAAFGYVVSAPSLLALGVLVLLCPGSARAPSGGVAIAARVVQALLFVVLLWRHPVTTLSILLVPQLLLPVARGWSAALLSLAPALALVAIGLSASRTAAS